MKAPNTMTSAIPSAITRDFETVVADAQELIRTVGNEGDAKMNEAKIRLQTSYNAARRRLAELQSNVTDTARAAARTTDDYVYESPWRAVGIGAAVGVLVGYLLARR
jgi:ElaB/YqjD/DUF883 family membrane-anchored ribosome-binding protein